jgi:hypothetical protein
MSDTEFRIDRPSVPGSAALPEDPFSPHSGSEGSGGVHTSALDELAAELAAPVERPPVDLPVPARPGYLLRVRSDITQPELEGWRDKAKVAGTRGPVLDQLLWAELVVGGSTVAILKDGEEIVENGKPVTFRSAWLQSTLGAASALVTVRKFLAVDAHLTAAAMAVLRASGFDDELSPVDPTTAS